MAVIGCEQKNELVNSQLDDRPVFELFSPVRAPSGIEVPLAIYTRDYNPRIDQNEFFHVSIDENSPPNSILLHRGRGSKSIRPGFPGAKEIVVTNRRGIEIVRNEIEITNGPPFIELEGTIQNDELVWDSTSVIHITGDLTVFEDQTLVVNAGAVIMINGLADLIINGRIECHGTPESPVFFTAFDADSPWGEIRHNNNENSYSYTFFTRGGGDSSRPYGHSNSQAVIMAINCGLEMYKCFIIDNFGKAFGGGASDLEIKSCLISRCDTGGEFIMNSLHIDDCWFLEFPADSTDATEDDNDGIYLHVGNACIDNPYIIRNSVFETGMDDGIDQNGAYVNIENCIISDFENEGIATSNTNQVQVSNTLVLNCEQGIEAGYGAPTVIINHCLVKNNETGFRFGDWYLQNCAGSMSISNSIATNNSLHNVWNFEILTDAPVEGAINMEYSLVNDSLYDSNTGCVSGDPEFKPDYTLKEGSPGYNQGNDGKSLGLLEWGAE